MKNAGYFLMAGLVLVCIVAYAVIRPSIPNLSPISGQQKQTAPPGSIAISIASSLTKREWMDDSVKSFNSASGSNATLQVNGKPVFVDLLQEVPEPGLSAQYRSGTMVTDTESGKIKPTIVSPAAGPWVDKLNNEWK